MRTVIQMSWPNVTKEEYDGLRSEVNWEGNTPEGAVLHTAGFDETGINVVDVWESIEQFNDFIGSRLMPAVQAAGIPGEPQMKIYPLHALFTPAFEEVTA